MIICELAHSRVKTVKLNAYCTTELEHTAVEYLRHSLKGNMERLHDV